MAQRFYIDSEGNYLGSYDGPDEYIPTDFKESIKIDIAPEDQKQVYDFISKSFSEMEE